MAGQSSGGSDDGGREASDRAHPAWFFSLGLRSVYPTDRPTKLETAKLVVKEDEEEEEVV